MPFQRGEGKDFTRIIPTAWMVAEQRTHTDIPYSVEIYRELQRLGGSNGRKGLSENALTPNLAPQYEARYKLINRLIGESGITQILELASGLTPRALEQTEHPAVTYVELELPDLMAVKRNITRRILQATGQDKRSNLFQEDGDALNPIDLRRAARHFGIGPIVVINEGLMRYLTMDEKAKLARNIRLLLLENGGVWVTPDITLRAVLDREDEVAPGKRETIERITAMNFTPNQFESVDHAQKFFEKLGFTVQQHPFLEVLSELISPKLLQIPPSEVQKTLNHAQVFVMRPTRP